MMDPLVRLVQIACDTATLAAAEVCMKHGIDPRTQVDALSGALKVRVRATLSEALDDARNSYLDGKPNLMAAVMAKTLRKAGVEAAREVFNLD